MRISDWSSDMYSSDLHRCHIGQDGDQPRGHIGERRFTGRHDPAVFPFAFSTENFLEARDKIGTRCDHESAVTTKIEAGRRIGPGLSPLRENIDSVPDDTARMAEIDMTAARGCRHDRGRQAKM